MNSSYVPPAPEKDAYAVLSAGGDNDDTRVMLAREIYRTGCMYISFAVHCGTVYAYGYTRSAPGVRDIRECMRLS